MLAAIDWSLQWGAGAIIAAAVIAVAAVSLAFISALQLQSRPKAALLIGLRIVSVLLVLVALMQPTWVTVQPIEGKRSVAIVIDRSRSMASGRPHPRLQEAIKAATALAQRQPSRLLTFDDDLRPLPPHHLELLQINGQGTDIAAALDGLLDIVATGDVGAVVLISDGADHGRLSDGGQADQVTLPAAVLNALKKLEVVRG